MSSWRFTNQSILKNKIFWRCSKAQLKAWWTPSWLKRSRCEKICVEEVHENSAMSSTFWCVELWKDCDKLLYLLLLLLVHSSLDSIVFFFYTLEFLTYIWCLLFTAFFMMFIVVRLVNSSDINWLFDKFTTRVDFLEG